MGWIGRTVQALLIGSVLLAGASARAQVGSLLDATAHDAGAAERAAAREARIAEEARIARARHAEPGQAQTKAEENRLASLAKTENPYRTAWKQEQGELRAEQRLETYKSPDKKFADEQHGTARHGAKTTPEQQRVRAETGIAPDGPAPTRTAATRFDSAQAEVDAVERAKAKLADMNLSTHTRKGAAREENVIVTGRQGGYGSGFQKGADGVVRPTGQYENAMVRFKWDDTTQQWLPITQYPTNKLVSR